MSRYEKFLGLDYQEYIQQPQIFDVSLFENKTNITSEQTGGMSITPTQNPNVVAQDENPEVLEITTSQLP